MVKSESIVKIAPALLAAQKEIGAATKDSVNPFYKSSYADLGAVMEACKDALNKQDISVLQPVGTDEVGVYVETVLLHSSGEFVSDKMRISAKQINDPQAQGSAITYARRYGLQSMVFIPAEDDDAEKATTHPELLAPFRGSTPASVIEDASKEPDWLKGDTITEAERNRWKADHCTVDHGTLPVMTSGPTAKHPGEKFVKCNTCGYFSWKPESRT